LAVRLIVEHVELEPLQHLAARGTLETVGMPDTVVDFKSVTNDRETTSSTNRTLNSVVMQLAIHFTVNFIVRTIGEGHLAAGTGEASLMPVELTVLAVVVHTLSDGLLAASAHHSIATSMCRTIWAVITNREGTLQEAVTLCATEVVRMPNLAHRSDLCAQKNRLTALCAHRAVSRPAVWAEILTERVEVLVCGQSFVALVAEEVLPVEGVARGGHQLLSSKDYATAMLASMAIATVGTLTS